MTGVTLDQVTAVLVTRGNVDMARVFESLPFDDIRIWNNGSGEDLSVYGRYAGIHDTRPVCFVQDDDCVLAQASFESLLAAYEPGHVVCNQPEAWRAQDFYAEHALVGFGAVFDAELPDDAFKRAGGNIVQDETFLDTCDVVFTALTPRVLVDVPYENLPWADGPDRMYRRREHFGERKRMLELALATRDRVVA